MSILKELKSLIKDAGGDSNGVKTVSEAVKRYNAVDGGGGGGGSTVRVIHADTFGTSMTFDITNEEFYQAVMSNTPMVLSLQGGIFQAAIIYSMAGFDSDEYFIEFATCDVSAASGMATITSYKNANGSADNAVFNIAANFAIPKSD